MQDKSLSKKSNKPTSVEPAPQTIALLGNPNVGKTSIFNRLTGLRHTTANYPGVTVEKRTGMCRLENDQEVSVLDLPGTYSFNPQSMDEEIVKKVLSGTQQGTHKPDVLLIVMDANNFQRNLYLTLHALEFNIPTLIVLNMWDEALESGKKINLKKLNEILGVECIATVAKRGEGLDDVKKALTRLLGKTSQPIKNFNFENLTIEERYKQIELLSKEVHKQDHNAAPTFSDKVDYFLTHPVFGWIAFLSLMTIIFQSIFTWANPFMDLISEAVERMGDLGLKLVPPGQLQSLVVDGVIAGVGNVIVFLPQILFLFFFIALLEDSGYMARAAFVLDRIMKKVGLNGKSFLPLLSSFACAIPGIMATRTINNKQDRFATIMVAPLMSCSARLPVYALMIGAFIPSTKLIGFFDLQGLTLLAMYLLSVFSGLFMAFIFRKTLLKGKTTPFLFELPPYRIPNLRNVLMSTWDRAREFLVNAGTIIFWISIVLWFLVSYPQDKSIHEKYSSLKDQVKQSLVVDVDEKLNEITKQEASDNLINSYAGRLGKTIEPIIEPLGFDWKIGIGLIASFAAREVLVSTLAITYNVGEDADETSVDLITKLQGEVHPETGLPVYTPLVATSIMVFFVLACQCMSTVAVVKRETNSWRWPIFMIVYMTSLAWIGSFVVFQGGKLLGFG